MSTGSDVRERGVVDVGATDLYRETRGAGPPVLFVTGATGDAGEWDGVAPGLVGEYTVVAYDRRGFSRSPRPAGWNATSMAEQADDAAALLRALGLTPAVVVGHSGGGSIACELVARHPDVVRHAVIYEAPLFAVVPGGEQIAAGLLGAIDPALAEGGPRAAMETFIRIMAGDDAAEHFAASDPAQYERVLDNGAVFLQIELPVFATFVPDLDLTGEEVIERPEQLAVTAPIREGVRVTGLTPTGTGYTLRISDGDVRARTVVVATGDENVPGLPELAGALPGRVAQLHSADYRTPARPVVGRAALADPPRLGNPARHPEGRGRRRRRAHRTSAGGLRRDPRRAMTWLVEGS